MRSIEWCYFLTTPNHLIFYFCVAFHVFVTDGDIDLNLVVDNSKSCCPQMKTIHTCKGCGQGYVSHFTARRYASAVYAVVVCPFKAEHCIDR